MTIIRREHTKNYTTIGNDCFLDETLSAESLGVLCFLISKPNDWRVMPAALANRFKCGRDRIYRILNELSDAGYVIRTRVRDEDTKAWKATEYVIRDERGPRTENPDVADLPPEKPHLEKPDVENQTLLNTDSTKDRLEPNTESQTDARETRLLSDWPADYRDIFWSKYPNKKEKARAMNALDRVRKAGKTRWADLLAGLERYIISETVQRGFVKYPERWIKYECWKDEEQTTPHAVERPASFFDVAAGKAW